LKSVNVKPIFLQKQHSNNLAPFLQAVTMPDTNALLTDIKSVVLSDPTLFKHLEAERDTTNSRWSVRANGVLLHDNRIFILELNDLHLQILKLKHNH